MAKVLIEQLYKRLQALQNTFEKQIVESIETIQSNQSK